ncbi:amiloride-sensitive sodium channel subunit gamma-2-like [Ylistrum balloti]|uniref:amiloride-sensitive sodium channel subunit gamma-2-like n=1 Tax=Ylistrum balloti TaxID=509963 RepID=UPI0029057F34|nr:amiloride-sensitive sodium channel subunit gamma-2-like [Ylistrum balloti]
MEGRFSTRVKDFAGYTSLHGLGRISDSKQIIQKIIWICLTLAAFGMCVFQVYRLGNQFLNFQVNTKIIMTQEKQRFPEVTFCNLNPVKFSRLVNESSLFQIIDKLSSYYNISLDEFETPFEHSLMTIETETYKSIKQVKIFLGLEMILNVEQSEYVPFLTQSAGVIYEIHDPDFFDDLSINGKSLPIGHEVNIGIKKKKRIRLSGPTGKCDEENMFINLLSCLSNCGDNIVEAYCQCQVPGRYGAKDEWGDPLHSCLDIYDIECIESIRASLEPETECPYCKMPCTSVTYDQSVSMTTWPSGNFEPILEKLTKGKLESQNAKDDLLSMRVFFSTMLMETTEEERAYTDENFVSDIGGQLASSSASFLP